MAFYSFHVGFNTFATGGSDGHVNIWVRLKSIDLIACTATDNSFTAYPRTGSTRKDFASTGDTQLRSHHSPSALMVHCLP